MIQIKQEEIEVLLANANKPISNSNFTYPLNSIDDRVFEVLTYSIFKKRIDNIDPTFKKNYDDIKLMQGVGEKGMDCVLTKEGVINGVIQCKKYSKNLSDSLIINEIVKFALHFLMDEKRFSNVKSFHYYISTSTGYTGKAIKLFEFINNRSQLIQNYDFKSIINQLANKYRSFEFVNVDDMADVLPKIISQFKYQMIFPEDYNIWINSYPEIIDTFFEVKKVTDNNVIERKGNEIIKKIQEMFSDKDVQDVEGFLLSYKKTAREKLNTINFIGFDLHRYRQRPTDITLTDLFIQPSFIQRVEDKNQKAQSVVNNVLKITNILKSDKNIVILGEPGAGKSLLIKYIIVQLLSQNEEKLGIKQFSDAIPFRVELRKYNDYKDSKSILEYIVDVLDTEYQTKITSSLLSKILVHQKTILFFDGLDEIFTIAHKTELKEAIEAFSNIYINCKCIVTSRFIGYHDIKFNHKKFDEFAILKFNQSQIEELVNKFYSSQITHLEKRNNQINLCISQIKNDIDDELKSNPLILTLILILASNNIVIPDSKLEIYEACTNTLVDSIDSKGKELKIEIPVKNKRSTFAHLAYWQYESMSQSNKVTYEKSIKSISDFLIEKKEHTEYAEAEERARNFLEYAEKRSIYFEDNFTHKTFLEYFTADYLFINYFTKASDIARAKLINIITMYLPNPFWYIVFELLFSRIDKLQADNEVLDEILNKQLKSDSLNVFYFFISNISKLTNISDNIKKEVIVKTIRLCIKGNKVTEIRNGYQFEENSLIFKLNQFQQTNECFNLMQEAIFEIENSQLSEKDAIEFYNLYNEIISFNNRTNVSEMFQIQNTKRQDELAYKDLLLFSQIKLPRVKKGELINISILVEQIKHFGAGSIFQDIPLKYREHAIKIDSFDLYLISAFEKSDIIKFKEDYLKLIDNGVMHSSMIEHIKNSKLMFFYRGEGFEKALKLYIKSDSKKIDEIILSFVKKDTEFEKIYLNFKKANKHPKLKNIEKLLEV